MGKSCGSRTKTESLRSRRDVDRGIGTLRDPGKVSRDRRHKGGFSLRFSGTPNPDQGTLQIADETTGE